jgi:sugar phosphate isomerase/epimerase
MNEHPILNRLAVCSWSLQPNTPAELIQHLHAIGLKRIQCDLDPIRENPSIWVGFTEACARAGINIVSGMFRTVGEDYSTMESIRQTGGLVPDGTWEQNWKNIQASAEIAKAMGLQLISFHAGFLPHEEKDPAYGRLRDRIQRVAELFAAKGIDLAFETGQETAGALKEFLEKLGSSNVGVNFDPANMILYDKGNPIEALRTLGPWLKQCHIKDARKTRQPGSWGDEVVVGTGEVDWPAFLKTLADLSYEGSCCIEREAGNQRVQDIRAARDFLKSILT